MNYGYHQIYEESYQYTGCAYKNFDYQSMRHSCEQNIPRSLHADYLFVVVAGNVFIFYSIKEINTRALYGQYGIHLKPHNHIITCAVEEGYKLSKQAFQFSNTIRLWKRLPLSVRCSCNTDIFKNVLWLITLKQGIY